MTFFKQPSKHPTMNKPKKSIAVLACLMLWGLSACEKSEATDSAEPRAGYATGTVVDTQGKPIAGAKILLDNSVFYNSYIHGSTGEDGTYRIKAQPGAWMAEASFKKTYNGQTYELELYPDKSDSFDDEGAVRNFTWKLEGRTPLNEYGYYGGLIQLDTDLGFYEDLENIELTLTPIGPLIDGSPGKTLRLRLEDHYWVQAGLIEDVPIGRYKVTAVLTNDDGSRPLRIQDRHTRGDFQREFQLDFMPKSGNRLRNSTAIIVGY